MSDHNWADNWLTFEVAYPALLRNQSQHSAVHVFKTQLFHCGFQEASAYWRETPEWKAVNCCHHCSAGEARHSFWVDVCVLDASFCWFGYKESYFLFLCEEFCFVFVCVAVANDSYFQRKRVTNMCTHIEGRIFATLLHSRQQARFRLCLALTALILGKQSWNIIKDFSVDTTKRWQSMRKCL